MRVNEDESHRARPGSSIPAWPRFLGVALGLLVPEPARASPDFAAAVALVEQQQFTQARAALEKIVAAEPANAAACHHLGRTFAAGRDRSSVESAVKWFARAAEFEPGNPAYLAAHGRTLLRLAGLANSLTAGLEGRDLLEQAVALEPSQLEAREDLLRFYQMAPWPIGSRAKAEAHLLEIARRDPVRGSALEPEPPPIDLARASVDRVFLSDAAWAEAKVGWGQPARNRAWFDEKIQDGVLLLLRGQFVEKGLHAHSSSRYVYALGGKWTSFTATVGIRDGAHPMGSAIFIVRGDGRELFRSPVLRVSSAGERVSVSEPRFHG